MFHTHPVTNCVLQQQQFQSLVKFRKEQNGKNVGTAVVSEMSSSDQVIKFLLDNKIQHSVVDEILERGFDSLEALSLLDPEDIKSQNIPVVQRRLLVHVSKSLEVGGTFLQEADHGSQPTPSTSS